MCKKLEKNIKKIKLILKIVFKLFWNFLVDFIIYYKKSEKFNNWF